MANNRKVLISNLPQDSTSSEIIQELFKSQNFKYSNINFDGSSAIVTLANVSEAKRAAKLINGQLFKGTRILVSEAPATQTSAPSSSGSSFVVVGNLSFDFTESQFRNLMSPHGEIKNIFLVRGKISKKSKGYGFIEYKNKDSATKAKEHFMKTDAKFVDGRIIRVETVVPSLAVGEAKHSRTVFVDKLPKHFEDEEQLINIFSSRGTVTFCKVARTKQGQPRGYALIDYSTVLEAERGQQHLDGTQIGGSKIRVSFCTPGKSAQDIFARFDDPNNRQPGSSLGRGQAPLRPGMVGLPRPRIPNLLAGNVNPLMARPGLPQPGPFRIGMPRPMDMMRPRPPLIGPSPMGPPSLMGPPNPLGLPGPLPGPALRVPVSQPGPNIRAPRFPTSGNRTLRPNMKPGQGVRKVRPNNTRGLVAIKPGTNSKKTEKVKEEVKKIVGQAKADAKKESQSLVKDQKAAEETVNKKPGVKKVENVQSKQEEKKPGENVATATTKSVDDEVKVLQPVFMDSEEFKQFQKFQELMKKQKESEKSGDSKEISVEDLVEAAKETKESENEEKPTSKPEPAKLSADSKQPQPPPGVSNQRTQKSGQSKSTATTKSSPAVSKPSAQSKLSPAATKPSPAATKTSHSSTRPSPSSTKSSTKVSPATIKPATIKLSAAIANSPSIPARHVPAVAKPSPVRSNTTSKSISAASKPSSGPVRSTQSKQETQRPGQRHEKTTPSHNSYQRPPQHQQRSHPEDSKSIKAVGSYERERKQHDKNSYHDSKPANPTSRNGGSSSAPLYTPPKLPVAANLLQKLFGVKANNKQDYGKDQHATTSQADSRSPYGNQSGGKSGSPVNEFSRGTPKSGQQLQYGYNQDAEYVNFNILNICL